MTPIGITDMLNLQRYFSTKREPTPEDKERLAKLEDALAALVDNMTSYNTVPLKG